jgi:Ca-activated chloride channel family protein
MSHADPSRYYFRPAKGPVPNGSPVSPANGADPAQPRRVLDPPEPRVLAAVRRAWERDRKPADILLAVDISDSMAEESRLVRAKAGLRAFLADTQPQDRVGLLAFSDIVKYLVPIRPLRNDRAKLERTAGGLVIDGGTALYDAVDVAVRRVGALGGKDRIKAVVVLSDGQDANSHMVLTDLIQKLKTRTDDPYEVRVYTIGYSPSAAAAVDALEKISDTTGGKFFPGETENIESVYRAIASFF